jgi:uncharacterized sulfatase
MFVGALRGRGSVRGAALVLSVATLCAVACGPTPGSDARPNLVLIIGDDHGYPDFGFMGSPHVRTPNLDRLAREGIHFPYGFATESYCLPSQRSLLTGLHPHQWDLRVQRLREAGVDRGDDEWMAEFRTLPGLLAEHGYASFQGGKLWEASYELAGFGDGMVRGGIPHGACRIGGLGRESIAPVTDFIDDHQDAPFFLWFAPCLPHTPHDSPGEYAELYESLDLSPKARSYYASISRFDDRVGELLSHLDARGLSDRTLVVYVSDNGWDQGPHASGPDDSGDGPKGKKSLYELGFRTPIIFHWPGHVPANAVNDALVSTVDLFPTFLGFAGLASPGDRPGSSLQPVLEGTGDWPRREVIGARGARQSPTRRARGAPMMTRAFFLRSRDWHYIVYPGINRQELYDLRVDPREDHNVAGANRERVREFRARIAAWRKKVEAPGAP